MLSVARTALLITGTPLAVCFDRRIDHNRLTGPIPRELSGLPNLESV